jgi:hypothetical protein
MKTPVEFVTSEIIVTVPTQDSNTQTNGKTRPHIIASRAARWARRANR